ncbi:MAG: FAD-binding oxidoreductase [Methylococcaceae bacterium]|nr:FAD-binding oxidoreductase [Methylococcaceae bacterium]
MSRIHQIEITTEDGETIHFECRGDEDVITAALRQEIFLMSSCREGGCATCKAFCAEGDYQLVGCSVQALPPEEEEEGNVLLCRCFPESDLELEVPYAYSRISFAPEDRCFTAEVVELARLASNTMRLRLRRIGGDRKVTFAPGQYLDIQIPGTELTRSFSPANTPNEEGELEFLIRLLPDGRFSDYLRSGAQIGQPLTVKGPLGVFGLKENGFRPRYFVAGGTGLAPVLSMVRQMHQWKEPQETRLYFGVNKPEEAFYLAELKALEAAMPNLGVRICAWQADEGWSEERGSVIDVLRRDLEHKPTQPDIYLCGPPAMVDAAYAVCDQFAIPRNQIFLEKFLPSGPCGEACDASRVHHHSVSA